MRKRKKLSDVLKTVTNREPEIIVLYESGEKVRVSLSEARLYFSDLNVIREEMRGGDLILDFE